MQNIDSAQAIRILCKSLDRPEGGAVSLSLSLNHQISNRRL